MYVLIHQRLLVFLFLLWLPVNNGTTLSNPCTHDAIQQKMFYHPYPLDSGSYVQCTEWGTPLIRRCPALQVWSAVHVTCVDAKFLAATGSVNMDGPSIGRLPQPIDRIEIDAGQNSSSLSNNGGANSGTDINSNGAREQQESGGGNNFSWQTYVLVNGASNDNRDQHVPQQQQQQQSLPPQRSAISETQQYSFGNDEQLGVDLSPVQGYQLFDASVQMSGSSSSGLSMTQQNSGGATSGASAESANDSPTIDHYKSYLLSKWLAGGSANSANAVADGRRGTAGIDARSETNMNPCSRPNARFIPSPSNPNLYYECVGLLAIERMCPSDQVWMQDLSRCIASTSTSSGRATPCSGASLSQQGGTPAVLPYPGDSSKYIVCYDSIRFEVGSCQGGQIWSGQGQLCIAPTSANIPPSPPAAGTSQTGLDICAVSPSSAAPATSFYHPYPPNPARFLQCDEFGNVYLRSCGPSKVWKDDFKTCVGGNNVTVSAPMSPSGGQQTAVAGGTAPAAGSSGAGGNSVSASSSSAVSGVGNVPAAAGSSPSTGGSGITDDMRVRGGSLGIQSEGSAGSYIDATKLQTYVVTEIFRIVCPYGYRYNAETGVCNLQQHDGTTVAGSTNSAVNCPPSFEWNAQLYLCVHRLTVSGSAVGGGQFTGGQFSGSVSSSTGGLSSSGSSVAGTISTVQSASANVSTAAATPSVAVPTLPDEANPCGQVAAGTASGFYFPFPGSTVFFIQCDATGIAFVKPCPPGLVWDQDLTTCVRTPDSTSSSDRNVTVGANSSLSVNFSSIAFNDFAPHDNSDATAAGSANPCSLPSSQGKYFPVDSNPAAFQQCDNGIAKIQNCPERMVWNPKVLTCTVNAS